MYVIVNKVTFALLFLGLLVDYRSIIVQCMMKLTQYPQIEVKGRDVFKRVHSNSIFLLHGNDDRGLGT